MTAETPAYHIKYLVEGEPIKTTRQVMEDNAKTIEAALIAGGIAPPLAPDLAAAVARIGTLEAGAWTTYTPTWTTPSGALAPTLGNGTLIGRYQRRGKICHVDIALIIGSTSSAGTGAFRFALPFAVSNDRPAHFGVRYNVQNWGEMMGYAIGDANSSLVRPMAPLANNDVRHFGAQNADVGAGPVGTGVPRPGGVYPFVTGYGLWIYGRYETA